MNIEIREKMHPTLGVLVRDNGEVLVPNARHSKDSHWTKGYPVGNYLVVGINKKHYTVHRIVAETFIPNPENKPTVDHIDRDRHNNAVANLRWATHKEQQANREVAINPKYGVLCAGNEKEYMKSFREAKPMVLFSDGKYRNVPKELADALHKLPVKERIYQN